MDSLPWFGWPVLLHLSLVLCKQGHSAHAASIDISKISLLEFCHLVRIAKENCTCGQVINSLTGKSFCETKNETMLLLGNSTRKSFLLKYDEVFDRLQAGLTLTASILAIVGNSLVIVVSVGNRKELGKCKFLIAVLAFTDAFFALIQLIVSIPMLWTVRWMYGEAVCRILPPLYSLGATVAMGTIAIIAMERYIGIVHPLKHGVSWRMTYMLLAGNAVLCVLAVIPQGVVGEITAQGTCQETWPRGTRDSLIYSWFVLIAFFLLPCCVVLYLYTVIIRTLMKSARAASTLSSHDDQVGKKRQADNHRIMRILVWVLFAFIALVLPNRLVWIVFDMIDVSKLSDATFKALVCAGMLPYPFHVAANPIIYSVGDAKFRRGVARLCQCYRPTGKSARNQIQTKSTNETELSCIYSNASEQSQMNLISKSNRSFK